MATMNISVPDPMRDWVKSRVEEGKYASSSDYVRDLIRKDQGNLEALRSLLVEGEQSGRSSASMDDIWDEAQKQHLSNDA